MAKGKSNHYVERDVSWMYFNHRILTEARKESVPLLERLSFLGIYSNNLDEFFRVRVASLNRIIEEPGIDKSHYRTLKNSLKVIKRLNEQYYKEYTEAVEEVLTKLEQYGIRLINEQQLNTEQQKYLTRFFYDRLNGSVLPIWLSQIDDITSLEDNRIYLVVESSDSDSGGKTKYALIKVPDRQYGRWIKVPESDGFENIMYLDDVIRFCLPLIFIGLKKSRYRAYSFKFTKDAEMEFDNDQDYGTLERIALGVNSRKKGEAVRVIYDAEMPKEIQKRILDRLDIKELDASLASSRYQNHKDLMTFPDCGHRELKYPSWQPIMKPQFLSEESILSQIRDKDLFIHVPYHSFDGYIRVLREAAIKPEVKAIKTTLYRLAKDSKVVKALITAARNGKKVTAVVELLARFDEESNIKWSRRMQEEGVNVIFGVEGLKVHSKLLLIESKKGNIACIGTGNFHEGNARVYTDYIMMTARTCIVRDVARVFDFIERPFLHPRFRDIMVSPNTMKSRIMRMFDNEIKQAKEGKEAWLKMKINHITDSELVKKIYEAAAVGVKVDILIRGNCSLVPNISEAKGNIRCVGIIDRYLEHSRIFIFCNGGKHRYYLGSADWMPRNLIHRIEVMTPVYEEDLKRDLMRTIEFGMRDNTNGRQIDGKGNDILPELSDDVTAFRSQEALYQEYQNENNAYDPYRQL